MANNHSDGTIEAHLTNLRRADEDKYALIQGLYNRLQELTQAHSIAVKDLESERNSRRAHQDQYAKEKQRGDALEAKLDMGGFILVVADGDSGVYTFKENFLTSGFSGGEDAGHKFLRYVKDVVPEELKELPVMTKIYANVEGIYGALKGSGLEAAAAGYLDCMRGFSGVEALGDFVAIGKGKERVDGKIRGLLEHFVASPQCRHIVFAACQDNGYVRLLERYKREPEIVDKFTLVFGTDVGQEFRNLPFKKAPLDEHLFMGKQLVIKRQSNAPAIPQVSLITPGTKREATSPVMKSATPASNANSTSIPLSWAGKASKAAKANGPAAAIPPPVSPPPTKAPQAHRYVKPSYILVNSLSQRIDIPIPAPSTETNNRMHKRLTGGGQKICNNYHLKGTCVGGDDCTYSHDKISEEEHRCLALFVRSRISCTTGLDCWDSTCIYGHNCYCKREPGECRLREELHGVSREGVREIQV